MGARRASGGRDDRRRLLEGVGRRSVLGGSIVFDGSSTTIDSSTPGNVGCMRSPVVSTPISRRSS